jgi:hypothetical protein
VFVTEVFKPFKHLQDQFFIRLLLCCTKPRNHLCEDPEEAPFNNQTSIILFTEEHA